MVRCYSVRIPFPSLYFVVASSNEISFPHSSEHSGPSIPLAGCGRPVPNQLPPLSDPLGSRAAIGERIEAPPVRGAPPPHLPRRRPDHRGHIPRVRQAPEPRPRRRRGVPHAQVEPGGDTRGARREAVARPHHTEGGERRQHGRGGTAAAEGGRAVQGRPGDGKGRGKGADAALGDATGHAAGRSGHGTGSGAW